MRTETITKSPENMNSMMKALILLCAVSASMAVGLGGLSEVEKRPATGDRVLDVVRKVKPQILTQVSAKLVIGDKKALEVFKNAQVNVISYKTQVVAGTNFFIKAKIDKYVFLVKIYEPISGVPQLLGVKGPIKEVDRIEFF